MILLGLLVLALCMCMDEQTFSRSLKKNEYGGATVGKIHPSSVFKIKDKKHVTQTLIPRLCLICVCFLF